LGAKLKNLIFNQYQLTASVGIAPNKFVAKIASDFRKPDGLVQVTEDAMQQFLDPLPIGRLWGVGPRTEEKLKAMKIKLIGDLRSVERASLIRSFGKAGDHLWKLSNGIDNRPIVTSHQPKSVGHEITFSEDMRNVAKLEATLRGLSEKVSRRLNGQRLTAKTVTLKIRYSDFETLTRQTSLRNAISSAPDIYRIAHRLLHKHRDPEQNVRLVGVSVSHLVVPGEIRQLNLF